MERLGAGDHLWQRGLLIPGTKGNIYMQCHDCMVFGRSITSLYGWFRGMTNFGGPLWIAMYPTSNMELQPYI